MTLLGNTTANKIKEIANNPANPLFRELRFKTSRAQDGTCMVIDTTITNYFDSQVRFGLIQDDAELACFELNVRHSI